MNRIRTRLKFVKSNKTDAWVGFIAFNLNDKFVTGVREDHPAAKKVCVVNAQLAPLIEKGVLYDVELVPMENRKKGYVVISAKPHEFEATISFSVIRHVLYWASVKFGNKTIVFDPFEGRKDSVRTIEGAIEILKSRKDIKNLTEVIAGFTKVANLVMSHLKNDGYYVSKGRKAQT